LGEAPVPGGDVFNLDQRRAIDRARLDANRSSGLTFHVYVGAGGDDPRSTARAMLRELPNSDSGVLVLVDPVGRALEIVTGSQARRLLDDAACALVALSMQGAFAAGYLAGGIAHGLHQLGDHARRPQTLHTSHPLP